MVEIQEHQKENTTDSKISFSGIIFLMNGISSLLGWNAILSSLDYFDYVYGSGIYFWFPIPLFVGYLILGILFRYLSSRYSYRRMIYIGIMGTNFCLVLLFVISILCKQKSQTIGFALSLTVNFFLGIFGNFAQLSFFSMINFLSEQVVSKFTVGTALSGLLIVIVRIMIVSILGTSRSDIVPITIYFVVAILFNLFDLVLNIKFCQSQQYIQKIQSKINKKKQQNSLIFDNQQGTLTQKESESQSYVSIMWTTMKSIFPYPIIISLVFIITFMLFPGITLQTEVFSDTVWSSLIFILCYNIGDTLGKIIGGFRRTFNSLSIKYMLFYRLFFFFTIPLMAIGTTDSDPLIHNYFFPYFNQVLFAFTNGYLINASFIMAFEKSSEKYRQYTGVLCGLCLQGGIMIGTFLALPLEIILQID